MLSFQWNALRPGDAVFLHDTTDPDFTLVRGKVEVVDTVVDKTDNLVVRADSGTQVFRPTQLTVHLDPLDPAEACWRCRIANSRRDAEDRNKWLRAEPAL